MPMRQIILFAVLACVIGYAGYDYFFTGGATIASHAEIIKQKKAELTKKLMGINKLVAGSKLNTVGMQKIRLAEGSLDNIPLYTSKDPFYFEGQDKETVSTKVDGKEVVYNGFLEFDGKRLAILNGIEYAPGEDFAIHGYKVGAVTKTYVILERPGEMRGQVVKVKVPINQDNKGSTVKIRTVK